MVTIAELLSSTYKVGNRRKPDFVFSNKKFGSVYAYNKTVIYKENSSIIELSMIISSVTDIKKSAHKVAIAIRGVETEELSTQELLSLAKKELKLPEDMADNEILQQILDNNVQFVKDKTLIQSSTNKNKFLLITNKIPLTSEIRVKCTCADFFYTFAWYNADHKVLIGLRPPRYQSYAKLTKKQSSNIQPLRNPHKHAGVCKHLLLFLAMLMDGGIINKSTPLTSNYNKNSKKIDTLSRQDMSDVINKLNAELAKENKEHREIRTNLAAQDREAAAKRAKQKRLNDLRKNNKGRWGR